METPFQRWHEALFRRRSRRLYNPDPVPAGVVRELISVCGNFRPFGSARALLAENSKNVFKGIIGAYGKIRNAPAFIAFIGDSRDRHMNEKVGYTGEGIILEATALGLGTCWAGKSFDRKTASSFISIEKHERVIAVTPVGYAAGEASFEERLLTGFGQAHRRKPLNELASGLPQAEWPEWIRLSLMAARVAPSAVNRQPWRFLVEKDGVTISADNLRDTYGISKRLDCGIAMLHIEIASRLSGVAGKWDFLDPPRVAKFSVNSRQ